ncbi:MAG: GNAT family N-acetyltransferase [Verrucomicrobia subdivision 3 bacterium]|nr:GNAT family N-acetyltransferase [Limisphaerales bacterium]
MMNVLCETTPTVLPRDDLTAAQSEQMYELLARHFEGVQPQQFFQDLTEKNWVILITREDRLVGFSTLLAYETVFAGDPVSVIYSGDTIMAPEAWRSNALARAWIASVNRLRQNYPRGKYYWLLLTSGFRTYRFLPVFWREFYPRFDAVTPVNAKHLLDHLAQNRFGRQYHNGIVRFTRPQRLRGELADIPGGRLADPHVAFFLSQNPGHRNGDELVCLTELSAENLTAAGRRMVRPLGNEPRCCYC